MTLFDVLTLLFDAWPLAALGVRALALAVYAACIAYMARRVTTRSPSALLLDLYGWPAWGIGAWGVLLSALAAYAFVDTESLRRIAREGRGEIVEGRLSEAARWIAKKPPHERLRIGDSVFEYTQTQTATPYPLLEGPHELRVGTRLRITHYDGRILKVETLDN